MHIPPVHTFWAQTYATIVSSFVCIAILNFQMTKIPDVCTPHQVDHFICPGINTFFTARFIFITIYLSGTNQLQRPLGICFTFNPTMQCITDTFPGNSWAKAYVRRWRNLQQSSVLFPDRCGYPDPVLYLAQEIQIIRIHPPARDYRWRPWLGPVQPCESLAR